MGKIRSRYVDIKKEKDARYAFVRGREIWGRAAGIRVVDYEGYKFITYKMLGFKFFLKTQKG